MLVPIEHLPARGGASEDGMDEERRVRRTTPFSRAAQAGAGRAARREVLFGQVRP